MRVIKFTINMLILLLAPLWSIPVVLMQIKQSKRHRAALTGKKWFWRI